MRGELQRGRAHEAEHASLGCTVMCPAGKAGDRAGDGGSQHDAAVSPLFHLGKALLDSEKRALEVGRLHMFPIPLRHVFDTRRGEHSGIADEDIQLAESLQRNLYHGFDVKQGTHVRPAERYATAGLANLLGDAGAYLFVTGHEEQFGTLGCEGPCDPLADSTARTRNYRDLVAQPTRHFPTPGCIAV